MAVLPAGRLVKVEFELALPAAADHDHIEEWLDLAFGCGGCSADNPLYKFEPEPWNGDYLIIDTGMNGRREEFGHQKHPDGSTHYKVRHIRTPA